MPASRSPARPCRGRRRSWVAQAAALALVLAAVPVRAQVAPVAGQPDGAAVPGSELRVWLVTIGPGQAVWERFGHNAIRILDTRTGRDVSYNWGIFDFRQTDFVPRFLQGRMLYSMAPYDTQGMIAAYGRDGREVILQELALAPDRALALRDFVDRNALPENRDYFYDYFRDNCSTRVRDALDMALGGALARQFRGGTNGTTWRFHIRRLTEMDPFLYTGMDLLLGTPGDAPIGVWEEMFLPMTLRDALREVEVAGPDGTLRPLVASEQVVVPPTLPPESTRPPVWVHWYLLVGVLLGGVIYGSATAVARSGPDGRATGPRVVLAVVGGAWEALAGVAGVILVAVLFTDHTFMYRNANLLLASPLSLVAAAGVVLAAVRGRAPGWSVAAAWVVVAVAASGMIVELLPGMAQTNAIFHALALPAHLGVVAALRHLSAAQPPGA
ncbi:MAG: DUF4105 domain-containing protein [Longimicrobiales bacterium]